MSNPPTPPSSSILTNATISTTGIPSTVVTSSSYVFSNNSVYSPSPTLVNKNYVVNGDFAVYVDIEEKDPFLKIDEEGLFLKGQRIELMLLDLIERCLDNNSLNADLTSPDKGIRDIASKIHKIRKKIKG